jgi:hypothetical protein
MVMGEIVSAHELITGSINYADRGICKKYLSLSSSVVIFMKSVFWGEELLETSILLFFSTGRYLWILSMLSGTSRELKIILFGVLQNVT